MCVDNAPTDALNENGLLKDLEHISQLPTEKVQAKKRSTADVKQFFDNHHTRTKDDGTLTNVFDCILCR